MTSRAFSELMNHEVIETTAAAWLARRDNAQAWTERDEEELQHWLDQHSAHRVAWLRLKSAWGRADGLATGAISAASPESEVLAAPANRSRWKRRGVVAALSLAAIALAALFIVGAPDAGLGGSERYATAVGARQGVALADGSRVTLNTATRARVVITRDERNFWLDKGEAFFDIQHDTSRPFVVTAGRDRITVVGTKFSVSHEGDRTQVLVVEGRVRFEAGAAAAERLKEQARDTVLVRNESVVADTGGLLVVKKTPQETEKALSWRAGRLDFDNRPLAEIAGQFNRYNRRQLVVDEDAAGLVLSGRFDVNNVDGFVRSIQAGFGVVVHAEGDQMRLSLK